MTDKRVDCPVNVPNGRELGDYANAFRVMRDGPEWILDFLLFSETENKATLVTRIRMHEAMLGSIRDRLTQTLTEMGSEEHILSMFASGEVN